MRDKPYYSVPTGKNPLSQGFDLPELRELFRYIFVFLKDEGYFQEALGFECVDAGFVPGSLGHDLNATLLMELRKNNLTPIQSRLDEYAEDDLFDIIEFLCEHCSKPTDRSYHDYADCGWHCHELETEPGRLEFRSKINKVLALYGPGYELSVDGEVLRLADTGLQDLVDAALPSVEPESISTRVEAAREKFRRYRSSVDDRRDAVRDLTPLKKGPPQRSVVHCA